MKDYSPVIFRVILGIMFFLGGISKFGNIGGSTAFFEGLGIPAAAFFVWLVAIVELIGGIMLFAGWKIEWAIWPLVVILIVATITVAIPQSAQSGNPMGIFWNLLGIGALISIHMTGAGKWAVSKS